MTNDTSASAVGGGRLTAKGMATRARIVDAASTLMLGQGVARTTIEDIQDAAKVSASQLYHYFADKNDLVMAVIDRQTDHVLGVHQPAMASVDTFDALREWRDMVVGVVRGAECAGGCPVGSLASDLAETDPMARARLARSFAAWEACLRTGLAAMRERGELPAHANTDDLALALLGALQGGLLLAQVRRETRPLEVALDTQIAHLRTLAA